MPNKSVLDAYPENVVNKIDAEIRLRRFKDYKGIAEWCSNNGWDIDYQVLWRRGQVLKKSDQAQQILKSSTEIALNASKDVKDDGGVLSDMTISIIQSGIFNLVTQLVSEDDSNDSDEDRERKMTALSKAAKASSELGRASIAVKKYKNEVAARAESAANKIAETAKRNGLSADVVAAIRSEILGVAG